MFLRAMTGHSLPSAMAIAQKFPWAKYKTFADIGTAEGCLAVQVALANPHIVGEGFDLPAVASFFSGYFTALGLQGLPTFRAGEFFEEPLPPDHGLGMRL